MKNWQIISLAVLALLIVALFVMYNRQAETSQVISEKNSPSPSNIVQGFFSGLLGGGLGPALLNK